MSIEGRGPAAFNLAAELSKAPAHLTQLIEDAGYKVEDVIEPLYEHFRSAGHEDPHDAIWFSLALVAPSIGVAGPDGIVSEKEKVVRAGKMIESITGIKRTGQPVLVVNDGQPVDAPEPVAAVG